jgi:hypothetical protein
MPEQAQGDGRVRTTVSVHDGGSLQVDFSPSSRVGKGLAIVPADVRGAANAQLSRDDQLKALVKAQALLQAFLAAIEEDMRADRS